MAKLYFYYSAMNAGKSTALLQASFNYQERGMNTMLFTAALDERYGKGLVASHIGIEARARIFDLETDLFAEASERPAAQPLHCVFVDEAQFLTKRQVFQLAVICDKLGVPVIAYGLRTDFQAELFEGSQYLLAIADVLQELKTICPCDAKATMNLRVGADGDAVRDGAQTEIGGEERHIALCRKHFMERFYHSPA